MRFFAVVMLWLLSAAIAVADSDWPHYGGTLHGTRYADSDIINSNSIGDLSLRWSTTLPDDTTQSGDEFGGKQSSFKATPILVNDNLIYSTGFNRVDAVDARTGQRRWRFDPEVDFSVNYAEMFTSRGVAVWIDSRADDNAKCRSRVFLGTLDARLIAIDANTGKACADFGRDGTVDLRQGIHNYRHGEYSVTSPPLIIDDLVITGSSIGDNGGVQLESGVVRAWDAHSGRLRWQWDPIPRNPEDDAWASWENRSGERNGGANVWTAMSADQALGLVYLPTTSPSPDFYGGQRRGVNRHANSIVALDAASGELVWSYQVVRHDLWDYDLAAQPMLTDIDIDGVRRAALVLATKMGFVYILDRETGEPLHEVREVEVPQSDVAGEHTAKMQRFSSIALHSIDKQMPPLWHYSDAHVDACEKMLAGARFDGPFTPPSIEGTLLFPGNPGGVNWGSMAANPNAQQAFVAVNRLPTLVKLIPRREYRDLAAAGKFNGVDAQFTAQRGTPYGMARFEVFNRSNGLHCFEGPWATLVALNLRTGKIDWEVPAGRAPGIGDESEAAKWGYFVAGGPLAVAGGVVFLATPHDFKLRAFDMRNGREIWSAPLPAKAQATPMSYEIDATQYVVIAVGGELADGGGRGTFLSAFGLDRSGAR